MDEGKVRQRLSEIGYKSKQINGLLENNRLKNIFYHLIQTSERAGMEIAMEAITKCAKKKLYQPLNGETPEDGHPKFETPENGLKVEVPECPLCDVSNGKTGKRVNA